MEELPQALGRCAERVARADGWITPARSALDGVTAQEAAWKPAPGARSIGEIVAHMGAWTAWATQALAGREAAVDDWPAFPESPNLESWNEARDGLEQNLDAFAQAIAATSSDTLLHPATADATPSMIAVQSILIHNAYHLGQIVVLRDAYARLLK